jgi:hypothetical protein
MKLVAVTFAVLAAATGGYFLGRDAGRDDARSTSAMEAARLAACIEEAKAAPDTRDQTEREVEEFNGEDGHATQVQARIAACRRSTEP